MKDTENFKVSEFICKCGCCFNIINQKVIDMAQTIREALGVPVRVNSGCRCDKYNKAVGGNKGSFHTKGLAADLSCSLNALLAMSIATFGGLVNCLRQKDPKKFSRLVVVLCTAAFAGLIAYYATSAIGFSSQYQCAFSGVAGYAYLVRIG